MVKKIFDLVETSGLSDDLPVNNNNFKQLYLNETNHITCPKPEAEQLICVTAEVDIKHTNIIISPSGESVEGQILTGKQIIIEGILSEKVEYVAEGPEQGVHAAHFKIPFSTFIVLDSDFRSEAPLKIDSYIEDIYIRLVDKRTVYSNITVLLAIRYD